MKLTQINRKLPKWPDEKINILDRGLGKTHLNEYSSKKLKLLLLNANKFNEKINNLVENFDCVVSWKTMKKISMKICLHIFKPQISTK